MSEARDEVLERIGAALGRRAAPPAVPPPGPVADSVSRDYLGADDEWETGLQGQALLDLFTGRVRDYRATVTATTRADVATVIATLLHGARRVVVPSGLDPSWLAAAAAAGVAVSVDTADAPLGTSGPDGLDLIDAVVTSSRLAIAETGTIVLDGSPDQGRRALSLVPDHHVCIVHALDVVRGVPAAVRRLDPTRPTTWISGPSATSDIELSRVEGVHGPRRLDVVLLSE